MKYRFYKGYVGARRKLARQLDRIHRLYVEGDSIDEMISILIKMESGSIPKDDCGWIYVEKARAVVRKAAFEASEDEMRREVMHPYAIIF